MPGPAEQATPVRTRHSVWGPGGSRSLNAAIRLVSLLGCLTVPLPAAPPRPAGPSGTTQPSSPASPLARMPLPGLRKPAMESCQVRIGSCSPLVAQSPAAACPAQLQRCPGVCPTPPIRRGRATVSPPSLAQSSVPAIRHSTHSATHPAAGSSPFALGCAHSRCLGPKLLPAPAPEEPGGCFVERCKWVWRAREWIESVPFPIQPREARLRERGDERALHKLLEPICWFDRAALGLRVRAG